MAMSKRITLTNWKLRQSGQDELKRLFDGRAPEDGEWLDACNGMQVQEALLKAGRLPQEMLIGKVEACQWISDVDWLYMAEFDRVRDAREIRLHFGGIDTVADVFLNGSHVAFHDDMYLPLTIDVTALVRDRNWLAVYFHSPNRVVRERLESLQGVERSHMEEISVLRKSTQDFGDFGNVTLMTVGLFEDVQVESIVHGSIDEVDVTTQLNQWYTHAEVSVQIRGKQYVSGMTLSAVLAQEDGTVAARTQAAMLCGDKDYHACARLCIDQPRLWWPKNYGGQPLYRLTVELKNGDAVIDRVCKTLGIRDLLKTGDMRFRVNGVEIKLWGGNLCELDGRTHRWSDERCEELMLRLRHLNVNLVRIWGGGADYGDSFYEACDQAGIMVYQDFHLHWAYYLETPYHREQYYQEALYTVKRLKHHPCILLWSGGNETWMHHEENSYEKYDLSYKPFLEDFARAVREADPQRFYLPSSPSGGDYPSDPSEGDGHPLYYTYRHSVEKYPVFASESARTSTGPLRSLKRFMSEEEIWPKDYVNQVTYWSAHPTREKYFAADEKYFVPVWKRVPIPETWRKWSARFFAGESAAVERFYEAHDAESLVYRYNAAFADFMRTYSEGVRRGKPYFDTQGRRISNGYMLWKINDSWPQFYCSLIDFFMETYIPYYQVRRSYSPILLSFEDENHLLLWGVNDTAEDVSGMLRVVGYSMAYNRIMKEFTIPVSIRAGESKVLTNLDPLCPIIREWIVYASLTDSEGNEIARKDTFIELERYLTFPEAQLDIRIERDEIVLTTDYVAHCVELTAGEDGEAFGWLFEDNYFNLLPFEEKRVKIIRSPGDGLIRAKAHYSPHVSTAFYRREKGC